MVIDLVRYKFHVEVDGKRNLISFPSRIVIHSKMGEELCSFYRYIPEFITEEEESYLLRKVCVIHSGSR